MKADAISRIAVCRTPKKRRRLERAAFFFLSKRAASDRVGQAREIEIVNLDRWHHDALLRERAAALIRLAGARVVGDELNEVSYCLRLENHRSRDMTLPGVKPFYRPLTPRVPVSR